MLTLLIAIPFSSASRMYRGYPSTGRLHALWIPTDTKQESEGMSPAKGPSPSPHICMSHLLPQSPESRQFTNPWSDTIPLSGVRTASSPLGSSLPGPGRADHQFGGHYTIKVYVLAQTCEVSPSFFSSKSCTCTRTFQRPVAGVVRPKAAPLVLGYNSGSFFFCSLCPSDSGLGIPAACWASTSSLSLFLCILRGSNHLSLSW